MGLFEDALEAADAALEIDPLHQKTLFRKAIASAYLFDFEFSKRTFKEIGYESEVKVVESLEL